jgi:hypothetical protein
MNDNPHATDAGQAGARRRVINLVTQAEAIVESLEMEDPRGRWALTAFGRHRVRELLGLTPYEPYVGDLQADPADLYDRAALAADGFDVPIDELSWRLALADALRTAARDIRMVQDATREV